MARLEQFLRASHPLGAAAASIAEQEPFSAATLKRWHYKAKRYRPADRAAALIPGWSGGRRRKAIPTQAWGWFTSYYLTHSQPTLVEAYRRSREAAAAQGWGELPSERTSPTGSRATSPEPPGYSSGREARPWRSSTPPSDGTKPRSAPARR